MLTRSGRVVHAAIELIPGVAGGAGRQGVGDAAVGDVVVVGSGTVGAISLTLFAFLEVVDDAAALGDRLRDDAARFGVVRARALVQSRHDEAAFVTALWGEGEGVLGLGISK